MNDDTPLSDATGLPALARHRPAMDSEWATRSGSTGLQSGLLPPPPPAATPDGRPRPLRVGNIVRSLVDDVCVTVGLTGLVVNVIHPGYGGNQGRTPRARVLWDNDTSSMAEYDTFEVITHRGAADSDVA